MSDQTKYGGQPVAAPALLKMPKPKHLRRQMRKDGGYDMVPAYTADEMQEYARAIAAAESTQPQRECSCGWVGNLDDCVWCGRVGPLCPNCHETTEAAQPAAYATQWWLASVSQHGNPTLEDGAHSKREGANQAFYLINALGVAGSKEYAVAKVELFHPVADGSEVDHQAVADCNTARAALGANKAQQPTAEPTPQLSGNSGQLPAVAVPNGYAQGVEAVAKMLEKKASDHASQYGYDDMGSLSFGRGQGGERKNDYYNSLLELAEEARAMLPAGMRPSGYAVVRMAALIEVAQLIDPEPIEVDGELMVYRNPMAAEALTKISKAVRTMLAPIPNPAGETCENGQPDCGPVAHHDIEGVPLCARCWQLEPDACTPTSPS